MKDSENIRKSLLSEDYDRSFTKMIQEFSIDSDKRKTKYFSFYPSFGVKKDTPVEFLIYGQAVNGWGDECEFKVGNETTIDNICKAAYKYSNEYFPYDNHGPLDWVNVQWCKSEYNKYLNLTEARAAFEEYYCDRYRPSLSFFWNVVYKTVSDYKEPNSRETRNWADYVVYSNLYKIAPSPKGNPDEIEKNTQRESAVELVKMELDQLKPKYCLVLTNLEWWNPFAKELRLEICSQKETKRIQQVAYYGNTKIIVAKRPFLGDSETYSREILNSITK
ncbi:MAG TPA: hypothetical protein PLZ67_07260 [Bacteroidales bacterium]|nr:hypothetical protein [Bacteroidales bacterium]